MGPIVAEVLQAGAWVLGGCSVVSASAAVGWRLCASRNGYVREATCIRRHTEIVGRLDTLTTKIGETAEDVSFIRGKIDK